MSSPHTDDGPPVAERPRSTAVILVTSGAVLAIILLAIAFTVRTGVPEEQATAPAPEDDIPELIPPPIAAGDIDPADGPLHSDQQVRLERGGWIQVPDPENPERLAQRYRCERLDPSPEGMGPGWVQMTDPRAELHLSPQRIVTLASQSALVFLNNQAMESGRMTGDVEIRMYESDDDGPADLDGDPSLVIYTDEADLDNFLGEVTCPGDIFASTPSMDFHGRDLTLRINDRENRIESLNVAEPHWIRLTSDAAQLPGQAGGEPESLRLASSGVAGSDVASDTLMNATAQSIASVGRDTPSLQNVQFYRLTLNDNVHIMQGNESTGRAAFGDTLHVWFALQGSETAGLLGTGYPADAVASENPPLLTGAERAASVTANRLCDVPNHRLLQVNQRPQKPSDPRSIAGPPRHDDVHVTSDGLLEMRPESSTPPGMLSESDSHLQLEGKPVRLYDYADGFEAHCGMLRFESEADLFSLEAGHGRIVRIESPQFELVADYLEVRQSDAQAELIGPGEMELRRDGHNIPGDKPLTDRLRITWEDGVELEFRDDGGQDVSGRRLQLAAFNGDVDVVSDDFELTSDFLDVHFRPDGDDRDDIEMILARGRVNARTARNDGSIACEELQLDLVPDSDGRSVPAALRASEDVEASGEQGTIWTPRLLVEFFDPVDPDRVTSTDRGEDEHIVAGSDIRTVEAGDSVQILLRNGHRVFADHLTADAEQETLELTGEDVMLVAESAWIDRARRLIYDDRNGTATLDGPGRLQFADDDLALEDRGPIDMPAFESDSTIIWQDALHLTFSDAGVEADNEAVSRQLRTALFEGSVQVQTPEFDLQSETLDAQFRDDPARTDNLQRVIARGDVRAVAARDEGQLTCKELQIDFEPDLLDRPAPARLTATGNVEAMSEEGVMWTPKLTVRFTDPASPDRLARSDSSNENRFGAAEVHTMTGEEEVQIRLAEGERIYADRVLADAAEERIELAGENVKMYIDNAWVDQGRVVIYDEQDGIARFEGPGRLRMMEGSVQPLETGPVPPPEIEEEPELTARWYESMYFDERANDGGGFLRLVGDVIITADINDDALHRYEQRRVTGHTLELNFDRIDESGSVLGRVREHGDSGAMAGRREVRHFMAAGIDGTHARIDALAWPDAAREEDPQIMSVRGERIEHETATQASDIDGAGTLIVHDLRDDDQNDRDDRFGGRGTTRFQWSDSLAMTREMDDLYRVVLIGDVQVEHRSLDQEITTLTSRRLRASILQDAPAADTGTNDLIQVSGSAELRRVIASDDVFIRTPEYDVDCDEFDYDVSTALATLSSETSRGVAIHRRQTGQTFTHHRAKWFMDETNRIIIDRGGGGVGN